MAHTITHLGAEHCVTGSCHLLQVKGRNMLIDCGMAQGGDELIPMQEWPVKPADIQYVFLTHAHIDHIGRVPELVMNGFDGEIITTHATKSIMACMLQDAMKFSELGLSRREEQDVLKTLEDLSWGFDYGKKYDLKSGITFTLGQTGHILGSCFVRFEWQNPSFSVVFSGDLGAANTPILPDPVSPDPCDLVLMESTYGDHRHGDRMQRIQRLGEVLTKALADKGKVFIPAFSLGRTQELIYEMDRLFSDSEWRREFPALNDARSQIPVFIDSPLGAEITKIYSDLSKFWDSEAKELFRSGDHPIDFEHLYTVDSHHDHLKLLDMNGPAVIIAGSGMCTGGRIVNHLREGINDPKNDVLFVGYQGKGTTGRNIIYYSQKPDGYTFLDGEKRYIRAGIHVLSGYSAHADQQDLINWVQGMSGKPGEIKLIHGEPEAQHTLRDLLVRQGYNVSE